MTWQTRTERQRGQKSRSGKTPSALVRANSRQTLSSRASQFGLAVPRLSVIFDLPPPSPASRATTACSQVGFTQIYDSGNIYSETCMQFAHWMSRNNLSALHDWHWILFSAFYIDFFCVFLNCTNNTELLLVCSNHALLIIFFSFIIIYLADDDDYGIFQVHVQLEKFLFVHTCFV